MYILSYLFYPVHSFVDLVRYHFTIPGVRSFLSQRISQDPLEKFFGCQTAWTSSWKSHCGRVHYQHTSSSSCQCFIKRCCKRQLQRQQAKSPHATLTYKVMNHYQNTKVQAELVINYINNCLLPCMSAILCLLKCCLSSISMECKVMNVSWVTCTSPPLSTELIHWSLTTSQ